jgi:hypothetical protein
MEIEELFMDNFKSGLENGLTIGFYIFSGIVISKIYFYLKEENKMKNKPTVMSNISFEFYLNFLILYQNSHNICTHKLIS